MKIKYATLHEAMFIPEIGQIKTTLSDKTFKGAKLTLEGDKVWIEYKGVLAAVPFTNFKLVVVEPNVA